jgi:hypothetical protein
VILRRALIGILAVTLLTGALAADANENRGAIYLTTLPSGADIWVDGAYIGRSPILVDALGFGNHTVTAAKTGSVSRELRVTVNAAFAFVDLQLERDSNVSAANGTLALHAAIPIRSLSVDGAQTHLPPSGKLDLAPGAHDLEIDTPNGRFVRQIVIYPETITNIVVRQGNENTDRAIVIAPAENYLPPADVTFDGKHITIHHNGHVATGLIGDATMRLDGASTTFDTPPVVIGPHDLLVRIGAVPLRAH